MVSRFLRSSCATGGTTQQLLPEGHPLLGAAAWSKYHCAVTRHKDSEPQAAATRLDGYHPETPAVSLDAFLDGDPSYNDCTDCSGSDMPLAEAGMLCSLR